MTSDPDCIFCKIVAGDIPAKVVLDTDSAVAFLDVSPLAPGHTLLIPRNHHTQITDLPSDSAAELAKQLPTLVDAITKATGAEGVNILQNNGSVAGQVVHHVHFHIIPRREGDGLGFRWKASASEPDQADAMMEKIKQQLV